MLLGLAAKNAILIVEFAKHHKNARATTPERRRRSAQRRATSADPDDVVRLHRWGVALATRDRRRAEMRQSLGTTVFFGMLGVTVFGLLFTPAFYVMIQQFRPKKAELVEEDPVSHTATSQDGDRRLPIPIPSFWNQ